jgi:hypothetical protein
MSNLTIGYDRVEDRLTLTATVPGQSVVPLWLTRRLARGVLTKLVELLMRSNDVLKRAPTEHREEVLLFEHVNALATAAERPTSERPGATRAPETATEHRGTPTIIVRVDFTPKAGGFGVRLFDVAGPRAGLFLTRTQAHQLLDLLICKVRQADWGFEELNWLDRRRHVIVPETASVS